MTHTSFCIHTYILICCSIWIKCILQFLELVFCKALALISIALGQIFHSKNTETTKTLSDLLFSFKGVRLSCTSTQSSSKVMSHPSFLCIVTAVVTFSICLAQQFFSLSRFFLDFAFSTFFCPEPNHIQRSVAVVIVRELAHNKRKQSS